MRPMLKTFVFLIVTLLTTTSAATTPRYSVSGEGDERTVADAATGLVWQGRSTSSALDWKQALYHCEALTQDGHDDWRLPDVVELFSVVDERKQTSPAINEHSFQGFVAASGYWTSTSGRRDGTSAYAVYFGEQNTTVGRGGSGLLVKTAKAAALCVRGAAP